MIENETVFMFALSEGFGFSEACDMSMNSKAKVSAFLLSPNGSKQLEMALKAIQSARVKLMQAAQVFQEEKNMQKAQDMRERAGKIQGLRLWESYCKKPELSITKLVEAFILSKHPKETATMVGLEYPEYVKYVRENEVILSIIEQYKIDAPIL